MSESETTLGIYAKYSSASPNQASEPDKIKKLRRAERFALQAEARKILSHSTRMQACCRYRAYNAAHVELWHNKKERRARYKGLQTCGSVWNCPVCCHNISHRKRNWLTDIVSRKWGGYYPLLVTFTLRHNRLHSLKELNRALGTAYSKVKQGRKWIRFKDLWGWKTNIRAWEVTYSHANGWHPHIHDLMLFNDQYNWAQQRYMKADLADRYISELRKVGFDASYDVAVSVQDGTAAGWYINKWGVEAELTMAQTRKKSAAGYTPFQLLAGHACSKDIWYADKFRQYSAAMHGKKQLQPANNFYSLLEVDREKPDKEMAKELSKGWEHLAIIKAEQWSVIRKKNMILQLLEVADNGNQKEVAAWLYWNAKVKE